MGAAGALHYSAGMAGTGMGLEVALLSGGGKAVAKVEAQGHRAETELLLTQHHH